MFESESNDDVKRNNMTVHVFATAFYGVWFRARDVEEFKSMIETNVDLTRESIYNRVGEAIHEIGLDLKLYVYSEESEFGMDFIISIGRDFLQSDNNEKAFTSFEVKLPSRWKESDIDSSKLYALLDHLNVKERSSLDMHVLVVGM